MIKAERFDAQKRELAYSVAFALIAAAFIAFVVTYGGHKARAQPTANLPDIISTPGVTTGAAVQIAPVNPSRRSFQICAFSNSINFAPVNPSGMTPVTPAATVGIPIAAGACYSPPALIANSGTSGGMGAAFQAIGVSGTAVVSFLEF